jgi:elongation factor Ts
VAEVTAALVKELRDLTGAGMMDCKRALEDTGGDVDEARRLLRERGMASAAKRADRAVTEGKVLAHVHDSKGTMVAVGCETEPVSNNEDFLAFAQHVLDVAEVEGPDSVGALEDERVELVAKIGENVVVSGAARFEPTNGEIVAAYVHPPADKIGVMVQLAGGTPELARMVAQHISFANPEFRTRDEVPDQKLAEERAVYEKLPDVTSKPEDVRGKIVEGMLGKRFFAEAVLADQAWIHDTSLSVGKALAEQGAELRDFVRFALTRS